MQINAKVSHAHNKLLYNKFQKEKLAKYKMCLELFKQKTFAWKKGMQDE